MNIRKEALFLADCLGHMPKQTGEIKVAVDTVIAGLKRIAEGGEWPEDEAREAAGAAWAAGEAAGAAWAAGEAAGAAWAAYWAAAWAAGDAAWAAADEAEWSAGDAAWAASDAAGWAARAADWAAEAHLDPDAERARQAAKREELGLNTKQEAD
jgi:hypothetical protein